MKKTTKTGMKQAVTAAGVPLVVTTAHKGVFFGYGQVTTDKTIRLTKARMCVHWSADVKGVTGLAANGPSARCRIGPPAPAMTLQDVTSIMECSEDAAKKWEGEPWG